MIRRDFTRLSDVSTRMDECPLGRFSEAPLYIAKFFAYINAAVFFFCSGALAGNPFKIDRSALATGKCQVHH